MTGREEAKISSNVMFPRIRIMIVDSMPDAIASRIADIQAANYEVLTATNSSEAIDKARASHPDVILIDSELPGSDSFELIQILKDDTQTQSIPVVLISPQQAVKDREKGLACGVEDFLTKPVEPNELVARVHSLARIGKLETELKLRTRLESQSTGQPVPPEKQAIQMIASDEQLVSELRAALAGSRYTAMHTQSADEGLEILKTSTPDLLIVDLRLANVDTDMDGLDLLEKLKQHKSSEDIPVLIICEAEDAQSRIKGLDMGADDYLIKPVNPHEFIARVEAVLRRKERQKKLESKLQLLFTQSITDALTGLFNRNYLYMNLEEQLHHAQRAVVTMRGFLSASMTKRSIRYQEQ